MIYVEDAETGEVIFVDTDDPGFRQRLAAAADERQATLVADLRSAGLDLSPVATDDDLVRALFRLAHLRRGRGRVPGDADLRLALDAARARGRPARRALVPAVAARPGGPPRRAGRARPGRPGRRRAAAPRCRPRCCSAPSCCCCWRSPGPRSACRCPRREGTVILAFDVSSSMTATDLTPTRMDAAKAAARAVRRAPTAHRAGGRRRVRQQRAGHPAADRGPGERARRDRPPPAGRAARRWAAGCRPR